MLRAYLFQELSIASNDFDRTLSFKSLHPDWLNYRLTDGEENLWQMFTFFCWLHTLSALLRSHLNQFFSHSSQFWIKTIFVYFTTTAPLAVNSRTTFTFLPHCICSILTECINLNSTLTESRIDVKNASINKYITYN